MKFFIDTANVEHIREAASWGLVDGVTTNPSLIAKEGRDFRDVVLEITQIVDGPISAEVVSLEAGPMVEEARRISEWHENIVIKVPLTVEGIKATSVLSKERIRTNVTLCFSSAQALLAAKVGASFVSPFLGRLDDVGTEGMALVEEIVHIYDMYGYQTEVIAASIRHPLHVVEAAKAGCHVATIPFDTMRKLFNHPLTDIGVERFLSDWEGLQSSIGS